jgi:hypothetical protein
MALAACDSPNPLNGGGGGGGGTTPNDVPADLAGNLAAIGYDADDQEVTIEISGLDADQRVATYTREPTLDIAGYQAYVTQDDPLDRFFTALVAESFDGGVQAGVVADGGQFNRFFGGGYYTRNGGFSKPDSGLVSYAGDYAGVTNVDSPGDNLLPLPPGTDPSTIPAQSARVDGKIFLDVDFAKNKINGSVYDRRLTDYDAPLDTIVLIATDITSEGTFNGTVEFEDQSPIGTYGGIFGGRRATAVGGVVHLTEFDEDLDNEQEYGVFVLTRCGLAGDAAECNGTEGLGE